jgi:hypothetical protein
MTGPIGSNSNPIQVHTSQPSTGPNATGQAQGSNAPAPRGLLQQAVDAVGRFFGVTSGSPGEPRTPEALAQAKMDLASKAVLHAFGSPNPKVGDASNAAAAVRELLQGAKAASAASNGAVSVGQALTAQLDTVMAHWSNQQLSAVASSFSTKGFAAMLQEHLSKDPEAERFAMVLEQRAKDALTGRVMSGTSDQLAQAVKTALGQIDPNDGPGSGAAALKLVTTLSNADQALDNWARDVGSGLSADERKALVTDMLQGALAKLTPEDRDTVLNATPSVTLARLAESSSDKNVHAAVVRTIAERTELLSATAVNLVDNLASYQLADKALVLDDTSAPKFAKHIHDLANAVVHLRNHAKAAGQEFPESVNSALAKVLGPLEDRIQSPKANLAALSHADFGTLHESLKALGVPDSAKAFANDATRRLDPGVQGLQLQLAATFGTLRTGGIGPILSSAMSLEQSINNLVEQRKLVLNDLQGAPEIYRLRNDQVLTALAQLPESELFELFAQVQSPRFAAMMEGLYTAADATGQGGRDDVQLKISRLTVVLDELKGQVVDALEARGIKLPRDPDTGLLIMPSSDERYSAKGLSQDLRNAIQTEFGVSIDQEGRAILQSGTVRGNALGTFAQVAEMPTSDTPPGKTLPQGLVIANQLYVDVARNASVRVEGGGGLDRTGWDALSDSQRDARIEAMGQDLLAVVGNDPAKLLTLTSLMHQGMGAAFQVLMSSPDNPIRLPNGQALMPIKANGVGQEAISFSVRQDPISGDVYVRAQFRLDNAGTAMLSDGRMVQLDPNTSYQVNTYEARVDFANHKLEVTSPVSFRYNVQVQADWQKPYPKPSDLSNPTTQDIANLLANSEARADLKAFMDGRHSTENLNAVVAFRQFAANPTLAEAEKILAEFIMPNSPQEVNSSASKLTQAINDVRAARTQRFTALDTAFTQIETMLRQETQVAQYGPLHGTNGNGLTQLPGWPTGFAAPADYPSLLGSGNQAAIDAFHAWAHAPTRAPENGAFFKDLADFRSNPSETKAQALFNTYFASGNSIGLNGGGMPLNVSSSEVNLIATALATPTAMLATTFDDINQDVQPLLTGEIQAFVLQVQDESQNQTRDIA